MLELDRTRPDIGDQLRLVRETLGRCLGRPTALLYPAAKAVLGVAVVCCIGLLALGPVVDVGPDVALDMRGALAVGVATVGLLYVVGPILGVVLDVAYCYELSRDTRPLPGAGLRFALGRLPAISLGALAVSGTFLAGYVTDTDTLRVGSGVLDLFVAPALATEDGSIPDIVDRIEAVATDQWGGAVLSVSGANTVARAAGAVGIASAVGIVVGHWFGLLPVDISLSTALLLAVGCFLSGFALTTFLVSLVEGAVALALYAIATSDGGPTADSFDPMLLRALN